VSVEELLQMEAEGWQKGVHGGARGDVRDALDEAMGGGAVEAARVVARPGPETRAWRVGGRMPWTASWRD
jgi:hypothetical protein